MRPLTRVVSAIPRIGLVRIPEERERGIQKRPHRHVVNQSGVERIVGQVSGQGCAVSGLSHGGAGISDRSGNGAGDGSGPQYFAGKANLNHEVISEVNQAGQFERREDEKARPTARRIAGSGYVHIPFCLPVIVPVRPKVIDRSIGQLGDSAVTKIS